MGKYLDCTLGLSGLITSAWGFGGGERVYGLFPTIYAHKHSWKCRSASGCRCAAEEKLRLEWKDKIRDWILDRIWYRIRIYRLGAVHWDNGTNVFVTYTARKVGWDLRMQNLSEICWGGVWLVDLISFCINKLESVQEDNFLSKRCINLDPDYFNDTGQCLCGI